MTPKVFLSITAPAYNERENIAKMVTYWESIFARDGIQGEIVIGDDGSTDGTKDILRELQGKYDNLVVVDHAVNQGYGVALSSAIAHSQGEYVLTIDSDGQFDAAEYTLLLAEMNKGYDVVTGYRHRKQDQPLRVIADRVLNLIVRLLFRLSLRDTNCALKLLRGDVARRLTIEARGYPTPTELLVRARTLGYRIGEVGITHYERAGGKTKLKALRTSWHMLLFLLYLKYKQMLYQARIINSF
ncbi:MAG: glycosyltransferase family 2 protein [Candidatus Hadarchaeum sp.]